MKNKILEGYDDFSEGKKSGKVAMIIIAVFSIIVVVMALGYAYAIEKSALDKVLVIDSNGRKVPADVKRENEILASSIQAHLSNAFFYVNSFERNTIKDNQARAYFLVDRVSCNRIFQAYNKSGAYNDAITSSYIYQASYTKLLSLEGTSEPYNVTFQGEIKIINGDIIKKSQVIGKGKLRYSAASFPNNPQGWILYDYLQDYKDITNEN